MLNKIIAYNMITYIFFGACAISNCYSFYECNATDFNGIKYIFKDHQKHYPVKNKTYSHYKYNHLNQNSYQHSRYTVKPGDTLFYIAWITGNNYLDLAKNNNITDINMLRVGQILKVNKNTAVSLFVKKLINKIFFPIYQYHLNIKKIFFYINQKISLPNTNQNIFSDTNTIKDKNFCLKEPVDTIIINCWNWPAHGLLINTFSDAEGGNKGIDISGTLNQPIFAAGNGKVVYVGNALQGYGNLIIIKHKGNYLSAYAHNNKIFVTEQQQVKMGNKIATMGNSGTHEIKLHFEIRHKGKSVDPLLLLPKNKSF